MNPTFTLLTAILMTTASLVWGVNLFIALKAGIGLPVKPLLIFLAFAVLAVVYWKIYFRRKNTSQSSGTE